MKISSKIYVLLICMTSALLISCFDHKSGDSNRSNDYFKYWDGIPTWVNLDNQLLLKVPQEFSQFWYRHNNPKSDAVYSVTKPSIVKPTPVFNFVMFLPALTGYTPENYLNEFDENEVQIISIAPAPMKYAEPHATGSYPPNMFERVSSTLDMNKVEIKFGLNCYHNTSVPSELGPSLICYGLRDGELNEYILLDVMVPPYADYAKYPIMQTTYFTKQYGGLEVTWRAHASKFNQWHEIDKKIWEYIASWKVDK